MLLETWILMRKWTKKRKRHQIFLFTNWIFHKRHCLVRIFRPQKDLHVPNFVFFCQKICFCALNIRCWIKKMEQRRACQVIGDSNQNSQSLFQIIAFINPNIGFPCQRNTSVRTNDFLIPNLDFPFKNMLFCQTNRLQYYTLLCMNIRFSFEK